MYAHTLTCDAFIVSVHTDVCNESYKSYAINLTRQYTHISVCTRIDLYHATMSARTH